MTPREILEGLPLAVGLQARNIAVTKAGCRVIGPGNGAAARAREILGDEEFARWCEEG